MKTVGVSDLQLHTGEILRLVHEQGETVEVTDDGTVVARRSTPLDGHQAVAQLQLDRALAGVAAQLAADLQLRGADAVYVAVAFQLNIPLVTWDVQQQQRGVSRVLTYTPLNFVF